MSYTRLIKLLSLFAVLAWYSSTGVYAGQGAYPVVLTQDQTGGFLIGGRLGSRWVSDKAIAKTGIGTRDYSLYSDRAFIQESRGSSPGTRTSFPYWVDLKPLPKQAGIAIAGNWNALPRLYAELSCEQPVYRETVCSVLASKGLRTLVTITRVLRVDIEGDGQDEVLISATNSAFNLSEYVKGDYSMVIMRKIVKGKVETSVICGEFHTSDHRRSYDPKFCKLDGLWDIDGDGKLELFVTWECPKGDGAGVQAFRLVKGRPRRIVDYWVTF